LAIKAYVEVRIYI